jgi:YHS domain-containing protein
MEENMVVDPVCGMTIDPAAAAASAMFAGKPVYFCSLGCRDRFLADPAAYAAAVDATATPAGHQCCSATDGQGRQRLSPLMLGVVAGVGLLAGAAMLGLYFGVLTLVAGWPYAVEQFADWWPYVVALAAGFGIQVGLFAYLRRAAHAAASGKVMAATGTSSGVAMLSCCTHYLVNLLPVVGTTGLVSFIGAYQVELFWFGIASNLAGVAYMGRRVLSFARGA